MSTIAELIHEGTNHSNKGDAQGFAGLYADDAVLITPDGQFTGPSEIEAYIQQLMTSFPGIHTDVGRGVVDNDLYFGEFTVRGTNTGPLPLPDGSELPATGRTMELRGVEVVTGADGRITRHEMYWDSMVVLGQLGLAPDS